jgi:hypothetical protein
MAVAIHLKATKHMDYHMKNFNVGKWRNFVGAWNVLRFTFSTFPTLMVTLGSAVMALRGSTNPAAASALADFENALIKNAHAAIAVEEETNNVADEE